MMDIVIIGAGGFGKEVAWLVERINAVSKKYSILGFLDDNIEVQTKIGKYEVIGSIEYLKQKKDLAVAIAVGNACTRSKIVQKIKKMNTEVNFPNLIDPSVILGDYRRIGVGNLICAGSILTIEYTLGNFDIINLDCTIGHEALIEDFVTLYPSVNVSGNVKIGNTTEIGTGSQIIQGIEIEENVVAGAGAVIVKNVESNVTIVGSPAKVIKKREALK